MDINTLYPSNYLKAADVPAPRIFTVKAIAVEPIGDERTNKPILFFHEETRGLVLNKTNGNMLAHCYGPETDNWLGRQIELFSEPVSFQGRIVNSIRVRAPQQVAPPVQPAPVVQPVAPQAPLAEAPMQPVAVPPPTPTAQPAAPVQQAAPVAQPVPQGFADLDEDIAY